jgi:hypothetical protein
MLCREIISLFFWDPYKTYMYCGDRMQNFWMQSLVTHFDKEESGIVVHLYSKFVFFLIFCIHTLTKLDSNQVSCYTPFQWFKLLHYTPTPFCNTGFWIRHKVTTLNNEVHTLRALFFYICVPWLWPYRCLLGSRYSKILLDVLSFLTVVCS